MLGGRGWLGTNTMLWSITVVRGFSVINLFTNVGFVVRNRSIVLFFSLGRSTI